ALALPVSAISRQRRAEEHPGARPARGEERRQRSGAALARRCHQMRIADTLAAALLALALAPPVVRAALEATETDWDASEPAPGIYFHWYEPSLYAGFSPRTHDPRRLPLHLPPPNQTPIPHLPPHPH